MADLTAVFGFLLLFGIAFPGLLTAWWLLFPGLVGRAQARLEHTPWRCFWSGLAAAVISLIPIALLFSLPMGPAKFLGWAVLALIVLFSSLGAAGLAGRMGQALSLRSSGALSSAAGFVRGAVALELAAVFPILGWFLVIPLTTLTTLGASLLAVLRRRPLATSNEPAVPVNLQSTQAQS